MILTWQFLMEYLFLQQPRRLSGGPGSSHHHGAGGVSIRTQFTGAPRVVRRPLIKTNSFVHYRPSRYNEITLTT